MAHADSLVVQTPGLGAGQQLQEMTRILQWCFAFQNRFPFSYRWGRGGRGLGGEVARTIQEGAPLVVQPVALEAGQQVEEAVLSDGVM